MQLSSHDAWEPYTLCSSLESLASRLVASRIMRDKSVADIAAKITGSFAQLKKACVAGNKSEIGLGVDAHDEVPVGQRGVNRIARFQDANIVVSTSTRP